MPRRYWLVFSILTAAIVVTAFYLSATAYRVDPSRAVSNQPKKGAARSADPENVSPAPALMPSIRVPVQLSQEQPSKLRPEWLKKAREVAPRDIASAFRSLAEHISSPELEYEKRRLLYSLDIEDGLHQFALGLSLINSISNRIAAAHDATRRWSQVDPERVAAYASGNLKGDVQSRVLYNCSDVLRKRDLFEAATKAAFAMESSELRIDAVGRAFSQWSKTELKSAMDYAKVLTAESDRAFAFGVIGRTAGKELPIHEAVEVANSLPVESARRAAATEIGDRIVRDDVEAAIKWVQTLPPEWRSSIENKIAVQLAHKDLVRGTQYALELGARTKIFAGITEIAASVGARLSQESMAWLNSVPDGPAKNFANHSVMEAKLRFDREDAAQFAFMHPPGIYRDRALGQLAAYFGQRDQNWDKVKEIARHISAPETRERALRGGMSK